MSSKPNPAPPFPALRVVPLPTSFTTGYRPIYLARDLRIRLEPALQSQAPEDLLRAVERTKANLTRTRFEYLSPSRGSDFHVSGAHHTLSELVLKLVGREGQGDDLDLRSIKECAQAEVEERPELEAYKLSIPLTGSAAITAGSTLGLLRGLTTFEQLFYYYPPREPSASAAWDDVNRTAGEVYIAVDSGSDGLYAPVAPYEIDDKPAFGWRGLLLDTSRNWFGVPTLLKLLDTMSLVKLNVFHWHITDSNSWPLDLQKHPELAKHGAYSPAQMYSEADVKYVIEYAAERGIDTLLEIDTPGHTATIALSHPEHIANPGARPFDLYAHQPPAGQLRFATDETVKWAQGLFEDVVGLVGEARYVGTGGDEINVRCMTEDPVTQASLAEKGWTLDQALDNFISHIHKPIVETGKTPVVWQEMALSHGSMPALSRDAIVHIWKSSKDARSVLDKGFKIVHAPADYLYLDGGQGGWITHPHGSNSWCDPFKTWAHILSFDPYDCARPASMADNGVEIAEAMRKRVLGGQACLWAEQTDETNIEGVIWPRAAAVADLFWTGDKAGGGYPRNAIEALPRMHDIRYRMVDRGVRAVPLQPHWCALRPELSYEGA